MSRPTAFTAALKGSHTVNVYDAQRGNIYRIVTLPRGSDIISGPIVFSDGFSVTVKESSGSMYILTYSFPLCNLKTKIHISQ